MTGGAKRARVAASGAALPTAAADAAEPGSAAPPPSSTQPSGGGGGGDGLVALHRSRLFDWKPSAVVAISACPGTPLFAVGYENGSLELWDVHQLVCTQVGSDEKKGWAGERERERGSREGGRGRGESCGLQGGSAGHRSRCYGEGRYAAEQGGRGSVVAAGGAQGAGLCHTACCVPPRPPLTPPPPLHTYAHDMAAGTLGPHPPQAVVGPSLELTSVAWARDTVDGSWRTFAAYLDGTVAEVLWRQAAVAHALDTCGGVVWGLAAQPLADVKPGGWEREGAGRFGCPAFKRGGREDAEREELSNVHRRQTGAKEHGLLSARQQHISNARQCLLGHQPSMRALVSRRSSPLPWSACLGPGPGPGRIIHGDLHGDLHRGTRHSSRNVPRCTPPTVCVASTFPQALRTSSPPHATTAACACWAARAGRRAWSWSVCWRAWRAACCAARGTAAARRWQSAAPRATYTCWMPQLVG